MCARACVCVCARACVCVCARACVCVCVCVTVCVSLFSVNIISIPISTTISFTPSHPHHSNSSSNSSLRASIANSGRNFIFCPVSKTTTPSSSSSAHHPNVIFLPLSASLHHEYIFQKISLYSLFSHKRRHELFISGK